MKLIKRECCRLSMGGRVVWLSMATVKGAANWAAELILLTKKFCALGKFKLLCQTKSSSVRKIIYLKIIISVSGGHRDYSSKAPKTVATPLFLT